MRAPVLRGSRIGRDGSGGGDNSTYASRSSICMHDTRRGGFVVLHDPRSIFTNCRFDTSALTDARNAHIDTAWLEGCWLEWRGSVYKPEPDVGVRYALFYHGTLYETDANGDLLEDERGKPRVLFRVAGWKHKVKENEWNER